MGHVRSWVIRQTLCFDSAHHAFVHRDMEITGGRISAMLPAGASTLADGVDGSRLVCTPGVVGIGAAGGSMTGSARAAWPACVTSVGVHGATMREISAAMPTAPVRTVALLRFGGNYLEQVNGFLDWFLQASRGSTDTGTDARRPLTVMPVLETGTLMSATELVEFAKFAKTMGARVGVRLAPTLDEALEFRARFYCAESALIAYLLPYDKDVTVFGAAGLDKRDVSLLRRMQCAVSMAVPAGDDAAGQWRAHAPLFTQGLAAWHVSADTAPAFLAALAQAAPAVQLDCYADALTRTAAAALGLADVGTLAPGMRADVCVFARAATDDYRAGSAALLTLLATRRPAFTIVDGGQMQAGAAAAAAAGAGAGAELAASYA